MSDERDPHLLAALRHAPDRDAVPPREVSERILAAARAAVKPAAPAWKRWLDWVAQPQVAGAFGTIAIATVAGLMWATREPVPVADEPAVAAAPRVVVEQDAARPAPTPQATDAAPAVASPRAVSAPKRDAREPVRRNEVGIEAASPEVRTDALAEKKAQAPAPAPVAAAPPPPPMKEATATGGAMADAASVGSAQAAAASGPPPAAAFAPLARARAVEPQVALDAAVQAATTWVTPLGRPAPGQAQRRWWSAVQAATAGRWQALERAPASAPALTLELDAGATVRFWLDGDAIVVADAQGRVFRAPVGAAAVRDWQAELARW